MLPLYEKKVTIAGRVCVASALAIALSVSLGSLAPQLWNIPPILHVPLLLTKALSFWYACWATIKGKGYAGWIGLTFPFIAIVIKDRHKNQPPTGAEMLPPKTTGQPTKIPIRMRTIAALLNIALLISVAYLLLKYGISNAREAWLVALMLLAPMVSLLVINFPLSQDRASLFLKRSSLDKRRNVDEGATGRYHFMLNAIFAFLRSLVSAPVQETVEEFITKFVRETPINHEEVNRMKDDLGIGASTAVNAVLLIHVYGIHLAFQSAAARKLIQHADLANFEMHMLSEFVNASLNKIGLNENAGRLYKKMERQIQEMDIEFLANSEGSNGPFWAATKRFLRIICEKDLTDVAIMFSISASINIHMQSTVQMFDGLYENGYRF
ncbi:MAG: hypothetical protein V5B40_07255 [Candidatus Accumulibacter meliphilus]|uniref:hypothetical protein n=1 Tax=Candidatus Accumulibacter meliphilus TaxID=2211374 RepID=UPI002FC2BDAB